MKNLEIRKELIDIVNQMKSGNGSYNFDTDDDNPYWIDSTFEYGLIIAYDIDEDSFCVQGLDDYSDDFKIEYPGDCSAEEMVDDFLPAWVKYIDENKERIEECIAFCKETCR